MITEKLETSESQEQERQECMSLFRAGRDVRNANGVEGMMEDSDSHRGWATEVRPDASASQASLSPGEKCVLTGVHRWPSSPLTAACCGGVKPVYYINIKAACWWKCFASKLRSTAGV